MKSNPFKFGSIVDDPYFTDRREEMTRVKSVLNSANHLTIISPRRYGKSSLIMKVASQLKRPLIAIDLQLVTSPSDLAAQLLKRIYRAYPFEKIRQFVKNFRIIPTISISPVTNQVEIAFRPEDDHLPMLEDVLELLEKLGTEKRKLLVIFDEFQEIKRIDPNLMRQLRSIMQHHKNINYVFLGSQESLIREIFEKKKSPFYHFGMILPLGKIPEAEFMAYLAERMTPVTANATEIARQIISFTGCHPFYTQQMAFMVWEIFQDEKFSGDPVSTATQQLIAMHDMDYERWWIALNKTDKKLLIGLSLSDASPMSEAFYRKHGIGASSTAFSSLKRLMEGGYISKTGNTYELDDPFFRQWLILRREA